METVLKTREFNYGVELLRIVSMLMVIILHILGQGGVLESCPVGSAQYHLAWLLEITCYCAVNCYALISGYVMINSEFKYRKILPLWLQAVFYSAGITVFFAIFAPQEIGLRNIVGSIFPVLTNQWWYLSAYVGLFFFIPFFNRAIHKMEKKELLALGITIVAVFSVAATVTPQLFREVTGLLDGYSIVWLMLLYVQGAIVKRLEDEIHKIMERYPHVRWCVLGAGVFLILVTFAFHNLLMYLPFGIPGMGVVQNMLVNYISPTILGFSLCLFLLFSQMRIEGDAVRRIVRYMGRLSFGVYLIHVHPLVWKAVMSDRFVTFAQLPAWQMVACVLAGSCGIYLVCGAVEAVRQKVFRKIALLIGR